MYEMLWRETAHYIFHKLCFSTMEEKLQVPPSTHGNGRRLLQYPMVFFISKEKIGENHWSIVFGYIVEEIFKLLYFFKYDKRDRIEFK